MARFLRLARAVASFAFALVASEAALHSTTIRLDTSSVGHAGVARVTVSPAAAVPLDVAPVAPGGSASLPLDLVGLSPDTTIRLMTRAVPSSLLDQDPIDGLRLSIERCSHPWQSVPGSDQSRYRCPTPRFSVLAQQPVVLSNVGLSNLDARQEVQHLLLLLTLPESAGNDFQGLSSTIRYTFTATDLSTATATRG